MISGAAALDPVVEKSMPMAERAGAKRVEKPCAKGGESTIMPAMVSMRAPMVEMPFSSSSPNLKRLPVILSKMASRAKAAKMYSIFI